MSHTVLHWLQGVVGMKLLLASSGVLTALTLTTTVPPTRPSREVPPPYRPTFTAVSTHARTVTAGSRGISSRALSAVVQRYCGSCHNATTRRGNVSLVGYDVELAAEDPSITERMIRKLRAEMMPPPGSKRPTGDTLVALVETLENVMDKAPVNPGTRTFQRMNRPEYEHVVRDLLGVEVNAGDYLPLDTKSANFDNISDVQSLSATLLESYLNAAAAVSRMALGDRKAVVTQTMYKSSPFGSQHPWDHVEGTPYGTRGGIVTMHTFPADGEYEFKLNVGGGIGAKREDLIISIDGEQVAVLKYEKGIARNNESADFPAGADFVRSEPIAVAAGQRKVSVAFVRRTDGPYEDLIKPHDWSRASQGTASAGTTESPPLMDVSIKGPYKITGISDTPTRRNLLRCSSTARAAQRLCAEQTITRLATRAYRRPITSRDKASLMAFYDAGASPASKTSFEDGMQNAVQAVLASPYFIFRFEPEPAKAVAGKDYRISDFDLASRLSFFLWGTMPDDRLLGMARRQQLSDKVVFNAEVKRMLADPRSEALSTRFAAQWLRLQDVDKVHPDAFIFPDFDERVSRAMQRETELFFNDIVRNDKSIFELFSANYTFVNERLAKHYGIPNVSGDEFRKVQNVDSTRRGIFGQGSMLLQTSLGNRTSPVLRGKWVMEVLLGTPPPPPPPDVPDLEQTAGSKDGKPLTTRERMELHRANPTCRSCHLYMDPIGLALDNFDVTGRQRYRENGAGLDTRGQMYDGTQMSTSGDLTKALLSRPIPLVRTFTENLMAYALGRRVEDYDQPTVRLISKDAAAKGYKMSSFVMGVVNSPAFRSKRAEPVSADASSH